VRPVEERDVPALEAFLRTRLPLAMFALSNLARFGLTGGHPHATRFWIQGKAPEIRAAIGLTEGGMVMPHLPDGPLTQTPGFLEGRQISGLAGAPDEVDGMIRRLGLTTVEAQADNIEPLFTLDLAALRMPDTAGFGLVPVGDAGRDRVTGWRRDYLVEVLGEDPARAPARAVREVDDMIASDSHRVLIRAGAPVAMTGFNARLPDAVQIGGVYTPPALRGQGHARRALALHLAEARADGARQAVLFAANEAAARAYRALGFARIGSYRLVLLRTPAMVRPV